MARWKGGEVTSDGGYEVVESNPTCCLLRIGLLNSMCPSAFKMEERGLRWPKSSMSSCITLSASCACS